jgi:hypothetical protein
MGWARSVAAVAIATATAAVCAWACGGSSSGSIANASEAGAGDDGGGDDGGAYTLDNVCARIGPIACGLRKSCCEQTGGYDDQGCLAHEAADCAKDVEAARAGRETFHPERVDSCVAAYQEIFSTSCYVTFDLVYKLSKDSQACAVFEGQLAEGAACERASECQPPSTPGDVVGCDDTTKTCHTTHFVAEGAACDLSSGLPNICAQGLYCDIDFTKRPLAGTCKKATALGQSCANTKPIDLECGFGNYCDTGSGQCTVGRPASASCTNDLQCQALKCTSADGGALDGGTGACASPAPVVKPNECKGP